MAKKYERQCWSCGGRDMDLTSYGARCRKCGATWTDLPASGGAALSIENDPREPGYHPDKVTLAHPAAGVKRSAAAARLRAADKTGSK
uniref:Uncharacterized protein n=1 Tax=viral metagenome TaxID=1070528 RepID=A0A6H2A1D3_9ZZZZ